MQSVICSLQSAVCSLQSAVCSLQMSDTEQISYINKQFRYNKTTWHNPDNVIRAQSSFQFAMNSTKKSSNYTYPIRKKKLEKLGVFFLQVRQVYEGKSY